jgi:PBSX family phage terminase large subunit
MVAPTFAPVIHHIENRDYQEYVFPGGRGSTKSSFVGLQVVDLIMKNEGIHALVGRQVADTLRTSVYAQIQWSIDALGLEDEFHCTVSPLEITRKSTGQKIYFRGADDPGKIKSIKVPFGYIGILWLEELDQFKGEEEVRKIEQSVIRGGELAYIFKSFNPPKSANNWANKYIKIPKATRLVTWSNYLDVPKHWLGKPFLDEAEWLKEVNPAAYENEYMGVANGTGGNVFDNVVIREITDEEISQFDRIYNGIDWGWYPDPFHFGRMHFDANRRKLYIFMEYRCNKQSNRQTADKLIEMGITANDIITCDSAEPKSIGDYKSYGLLARAAEKGPGSVEYSMKWLQSLTEIIIDNSRCPYTANEFLNYEYERDKEGNIISGYPDKDNHAIDSVRYAMNPVWKRRGQ